MADLKMMLQNLRDKSKCCKKDDFTGERYTIIHDMSIETLNMICEYGIEQLENAQTVNRWISVDDALPEIYEKVLTADIYGYVTENYRCNVRTGLEWANGFRITHWMPLPEPPKNEQK